MTGFFKQRLLKCFVRFVCFHSSAEFNRSGLNELQHADIPHLKTGTYLPAITRQFISHNQINNVKKYYSMGNHSCLQIVKKRIAVSAADHRQRSTVSSFYFNSLFWQPTSIYFCFAKFTVLYSFFSLQVIAFFFVLKDWWRCSLSMISQEPGFNLVQ